MRIRGFVSYKGTNYLGWQIQPKGITVEGEIERVLSEILNRPINIIGAGRTDAGVHALGQVFHFDVENLDMDLDRLRYSANKMLPSDIDLHALQQVEDSFHSRYNAIEKIYKYSISFAEKIAILNDIVYACPIPTDIELFEEALKLFKGRHCFQDFTSKEEDFDNFVREIYEVQVEVDDADVTILFRGSGFMRYQIRYMVGAALAVAWGKQDISFITNHLDEDKQREIISYKAPGHGLMLVGVNYSLIN